MEPNIFNPKGSAMTTITIKNLELVKKIREAADRRQMGITVTLNEILVKDLALPTPIGEDDPIVQHILEIGRRNRERFPNILGSQDIEMIICTTITTFRDSGTGNHQCQR